MLWDVIIAGGGPAGASAALAAAEQGLEALVLEAQPVPGSKVCAGGVSKAALQELGGTLPESVAERHCRELRPVSVKGRFSFLRTDPFMVTVARERFDCWLLNRAQAAGAEVSLGERVTGLTPGPDGVTVRTSAGERKGRLVIGADGAISTAARWVRPALSARELGLGVAVEVADPSGAVLERLSEAIEIHYGLVPGGYGWVFPRRDRLACGVAGPAHAVRDPRQALAALLSLARLSSADCLGQPRTGLIPAGGPRRAVVRGRVLLAGDAAGLADALTGEGIRYALRSGRLAGRAAARALRGGGVERSLAEYGRECGAMTRALAWSWRIAHLFLAHEGLMLTCFLGNEAWYHGLIDLLNGDTDQLGMLRRLAANLPKQLLRRAAGR